MIITLFNSRDIVDRKKTWLYFKFCNDKGIFLQILWIFNELGLFKNNKQDGRILVENA